MATTPPPPLGVLLNDDDEGNIIEVVGDCCNVEEEGLLHVN